MNRILSAILALCLMLTFTVTAFAQSTPDQVVPSVSDDASIQAAWDALNAIDEAMNNSDYQGMVSALQTVDDLVEKFSDAQIEEWTEVVENNMGLEKYFDLLIGVVTIETVKLCMDDYVANPNFETAYYFVFNYEGALGEGFAVDKMFDGIDTAYQNALNDMPDEKIVKVYEAYEAVADALVGPWVEDFDSAIEGFESVLDDFNSLTQEELTQLGVLMGVESGEEAFSWVLSDWVNLNVCDTMVEYYEAYRANPSKDTAATFVDYYDTIMNGDDEELKELVLWCFDEDIEYIYSQAKAMIDDTQESTGGATEPKPQPQQSADSEKTDESAKVNTSAVNTDGTTNAVIVLFAMFVLAAGLGIFMKKVK